MSCRSIIKGILSGPLLFVLPEIASANDLPDKRWLKLLHYQSNLISTIDYQEFFFAENGKTNPQDELNASRKAIAVGIPKVTPLKLDPICAFPARARYFHEVLGDKLRKPECKGLQHWKKSLPLMGVSLVYSTAYSGNPASLFGHTFFKLRLKGKDGQHDPLLDYGASFTAFPEKDNGFLYFIKGLTGGYKGIFNIEPFYTHLLGYAYRENRDLWEYDLDFSKEEQVVFLEHFWELTAAANADYFFLDDNCSSLLLETIEAVRPSWDLVSKKGFFVLPNRTISLIANASPKDLVFYPSERRQFNSMILSLNEAEKDQLDGLIGHTLNPDTINNPAVHDAALSFLTIQKSELKLSQQKKIRKLEHQILSQRSKLGKAPAVARQARPKNRPDIAHKPSKVSLGWDFMGDVWELRSRYGLHSLLDSPNGYEPFYQMNYFDLTLEEEGKSSIQWDFKVADVLALVPWSRYRKSVSWRAYGGMQSADSVDCGSCLLAYGGGGIGVAKALIPSRLLIYSMPSFEVKINSHEIKQSLSVGKIDLNVFWDISQGWRMLFTATQSRIASFDNKFQSVKEINLSQQASLTKDLVVELSSSRKDSSWAQKLSFGLFF